jgi:hypothetical protein
MSDELSISEKLQQVQEGDYLLWNGRTKPQPVVKVGHSHFIVEGSRGGRYEFNTNSTLELKNLNNDTYYDIDDLSVLRPLSSFDG